MIINIRDEAIASLCPTAKYALAGDEITWLDEEITQPTESEITVEQARLQAIHDGNDYSRARRAEYNLLNQDEMRFDDAVNDTTTWIDAIQAIKAAHPKP
jgi:hypothetical protein